MFVSAAALPAPIVAMHLKYSVSPTRNVSRLVPISTAKGSQPGHSDTLGRNASAAAAEAKKPTERSACIFSGEKALPQ